MAEYKFKIGGKDYAVTIDSVEGGKASVTVNGAAYEVEIEKGAPAAAPSVPAAAGTTAPAPVQDAPKAAAPKGEGTKVVTPMPGVIIEVSVREGQAVKAGEKVAVLEAMKMENEISAPSDGTVTAIHVQNGASVNEGDPVVTIA